MAVTPKRFFRRMGADQPQAIVEHKLGRFPVVDVYELLDVTDKKAQFFLYYGHEELDLLQPKKKIPRQLLGTPLASLLSEYCVAWQDDNSLGDVVNDFLDAFFKLPGADDMDHKKSDWIDKHLDSSIRDLKRRDEWNDVRWLVRPSKLLVGSAVGAVTPLVNVEHLSFDALRINTIDPLGKDFIDLMVVLGGESPSD